MNSTRWLAVSVAVLGWLFSGTGPSESAPLGEFPDRPVTALGIEGLARDAGAGNVPTPGDRLLGITFSGDPNAALVSFDPVTGTILQTHLLLNPYELFVGMTFDRKHHKVYVVSEGTHNLYSIDPRTLAVRHVGNLRIARELGTVTFDAGPLAYDPVGEILYTAINYRDLGTGEAWPVLGRIDPATAEVVIGRSSI